MVSLTQVGHENEVDEDGWEYVEEGPPEIIWQGDEIIVKKRKIRVKKKDTDQQIMKEVSLYFYIWLSKWLHYSHSNGRMFEIL